MAGKNRDVKPGEKVPASGLYQIIGPRSGETGRERTMARGETASPTPKPGETHRIAERAKNESGRG